VTIIPARHAATIHGPTPVTLGGRQGLRYWVQHPFVFTGRPEVDERLSGYPVLVFQPAGRPPAETPLVIGLQGIAAPLEWNGFLVPTLLDMGLACVLFDTPLAGERSLVRNHLGDIVNEVVPLVRHRAKIGTYLVLRLFQAVARDFRTVLDLVAERHGLCDECVALFGVSLGSLLSAYAFLRHGIGTRLLGAIGHADIHLFASSYAPRFTPLFTSLPGRMLGRVAALCRLPMVRAGIDFLAVLRRLTTADASAVEANPMTYLDRIGSGRPVRFLVGADDPLVRPHDAEATANRFPDGACYVVPGMGHGGDGFEQHVRYYVGTQLGDWR
jgi:pimeloyl-ACP methyl ester carboxylesterase